MKEKERGEIYKYINKINMLRIINYYNINFYIYIQNRHMLSQKIVLFSDKYNRINILRNKHNGEYMYSQIKIFPNIFKYI